MHIAVTLSASQNVSKGYVNGVLTGTGTYSDTFGGGSAQMIWGNRLSLGGTWANGAYDDLRWYTRALTATQVQQAYVESRRGEPTLLRPPLLVLGLAPGGTLGSFLPFFSQP
jgi:Concanavalin A-like lectin/glucanases superfamily